MNKKIMLAIILIIIIVFPIVFASKTRDGKSYEKFKPAPNNELPMVLRNYMKQNFIPYSYYEMPNYVVDFLKYDKDYSIAYNSGKFVIITYSKEESRSNKQSLKDFYKKLKSLLPEVQDKYILVERNEITTPHYVLDFDRQGYADLRSHCKNFCLINPKDNTMFVLYRISNSENEALELLLQQYILSDVK